MMDDPHYGSCRPLVAKALGSSPVEMSTLVPTPGLIKGESQEKLNTTLYQCARDGNLEDLCLLLDKMSPRQLKRKINKLDEDFQSPLHYAVRYNHFDIVKILVERGADVNIEDEELATSLHYAARYRRQKMTPISDSKPDVSWLEGSLPGSRHGSLPGSRHGSRRCSESKQPEDKTPSAAGDTPDMTDGEDTSEMTQPPAGVTSDTDTITGQVQKIIRYLVKMGADINHSDEYGLRPLHYAAMKGNDVAMSELLTIDGVDIEAADKQEMTALHLAATHNQIGVAKLLINIGAQLRCVDEELSTPLHLACKEGNLELAKMLFEAGEKQDGWVTVSQMVTDQDMDQSTPLHKAVEGGHFEVAKYCIEKGADVNTYRGGWNTCLHLAAVAGDLNLIRLLLDNNARIDALNDQLATPLHRAAAFDHADVCKHLIERGAQLEKRNKDNFTPLLTAAFKGHEKTLIVLLKRRADIFAMDKNEKTCIYLAASEDKLAALKVLLSHPTVILVNLIDFSDRYGNTPLHVAAEKGFVRIIKCLLEHKANTALKNEDEQTAIHLAGRYGRKNVICELIKSSKLLVHDEDEDSNTPLHLAAQYGQVKAVRVLIEGGADVQARNCSMWTPLDCAAAGGWSKAARALLENDSPVDPVDKAKTTPLHLASARGYNAVCQLLLDWNASVGLRDKDGSNCLDMAIENNHKKVALTIINSPNWMDAMRNEIIDPRTGFRDTPMRKLIRKMPGIAEEVFNRCSVANHRNPEYEKYNVTFNYEFLDDMYSCWHEIDTGDSDSALDGYYDEEYKLKPEAQPYTTSAHVMKTNHPLKIMVTSKRKTLLAHPLVTALLQHKWNSYGCYFYYINLSFYLIFLALLTVYVVVNVDHAPYHFYNVTDVQQSNAPGLCLKVQQYLLSQGTVMTLPTVAVICKYGIIVFTVLMILRELFQIWQAKMNYFGLENAIEWVTYVSALLLVIDVENPCQRETGLRLAWQWQLGAVAIFWAWIDLILFIRKVPMFGIYVVMFLDVLRTFTRFFPVFFLFIIAFALSFYTLLSNQVPFRDVIPALIKTSVMMTGDVAYDDIFNDMHSADAFDRSVQTWYEIATMIQFVIFLFVMVILIMNLLVGLAVDDIKAVQEQAVLKRLAMQVELALDVECFVPTFISRRFVVKSQKIKPNKQEKWYQSLFIMEKTLSAHNIAAVLHQDAEPSEQDKISDQLDSMEGRVKHIEYMLKSLMKHSQIQFEAVDVQSEDRISSF